MDSKKLNKNIKRELFHLTPRSELLSETTEDKFFSKLDASAGFWQISLDTKNTKIYTFNTPLGRYCFLRLLLEYVKFQNYFTIQ